MNPQLEECSEWIKKVNNDLLSARILINHERPVTDTACFHCQQAVEKVLKTYLVSRTVRFERIHNLAYLANLCEVQDRAFSEMRSKIEALTPFAVEIRYPGDMMEISMDEARQMLSYAEQIVGFVAGHLPDEIARLLKEKQ